MISILCEDRYRGRQVEAWQLSHNKAIARICKVKVTNGRCVCSCH